MEESDSEKKMEKENLGTRMDPPIGEPEGSLGWVLPNTAMKKKVLLMGKSGSGKTSMRSIIFANYIARDTRRLGATILDRLHSLQINSSLSTYSLVDSVGNTKTFDVEHSHVRFLGNLVLNLWDCGGQDTFMENYFTSQRDNIFRNVEVLIYVFDVESRELEKDMHYYQSCLEAILQNSPDAKIFCLVHKMDLVQEDQRDLGFPGGAVVKSPPADAGDAGSCPGPGGSHMPWSGWACEPWPLSLRVRSLCSATGEATAVRGPRTAKKTKTKTNKKTLINKCSMIFKEREEDLRRLSRPLECSCFRTSIWDETLYKAWSSIVYQLIPNVQQLEMNLRNFAEIIEADEVLLFERATFLVISHYQCKEQRDVHRFEKISNIIKQFKLSCSKLAASFQSMEVRNSNFAAFIDIFTSNTYVMVVMSDPSIPSAATLINIRNARKHFEKLERVDGPKQCLLMR
ncbi:ras-related GTP-binding protein B isoform X1 [Globicephala melas]|uniref:ras-related GTP-binding protein B isoform X1 n=2 Tax=Globicephala melas TaxID=9731 RepID=UPI00293D6643|nr:ras-related GTP-binding protein B isoform X1 [Globicephala melas]